MYERDGSLVIDGAAVGGGVIPDGTGVYLVTLSWGTGGWIVSTQRTRDDRNTRVIFNNSQLHRIRVHQVDAQTTNFDVTIAQQWPWQVATMGLSIKAFDPFDNSFLAPWEGGGDGLFVTYIESPYRVPPSPTEIPVVSISIAVDSKAIVVRVDPEDATNTEIEIGNRLSWNTPEGARNIVNLLQLGTAGIGVIQEPRYVEFLRGSQAEGDADLDAYFTLDNGPGYWIVMTPSGGRTEYPVITTISADPFTRNPMSQSYHTATDLFRIEQNIPMSYFIRAYSAYAPTPPAF
jgi:hypothetical protein